MGIEPTKAVVDYTSDLYTSYNAVLGAVAGTAAPKTHSFNYADVDVYTDNTGEKTMFTDYILIPAGDSETVIFSIDIQDATGTIKKTEFNSAIPVEVNKLTTLRGAVLTEGGKVSITVDGELGEKETINYVDNAESLQEAINAIEEGKSGNIKLGGNVDLLPEAVLFQDLSQSRLAAGVDVGGVKIVDALLHRQTNLLPGGVHVDLSVFLGEPQAAESQHRQLVPVFVHTVLHVHPSLFSPSYHVPPPSARKSCTRSPFIV